MDLIRCKFALLLALLCAATAHAECMGQHDGLDGGYEQLITSNPSQAVQQLQSLLKPSPDANNPGERAHQWLMLADAYDALGQHADAVASIARGIASVGVQTNPRIVLRLHLREAGMREDSASAAAVLAHYEEVASVVTRDNPYYFCVLQDRGYLRYRADQFGPAISDLTTSISLARARGLERDRIDAGSALSLVYQALGFFDESLALANESVAYYEDSKEPIALADALYRRGRARTSMGDFAAAESDLRRAFATANFISDATDAFFAQITLCDLLVSSRRTAEAQSVCEDAAVRARAIDDREGQTRAQIMQAESRLQAGYPQRAVALIDAALASGGKLLRQTFLARAVQARAQAQASLGEHRAAYADLQRSFAIAREVGAARASQQVDLLRVRFEIGRKDRELLLARQETELLETRASNDRVLRNFIIAIAVIALLGSWLLVRAQQRRRFADAARRIAESQLESLGRLAAGVAHDFNNLLTVVQQAAGLLARMPAISADPDAASLVRATREAAVTGGSITAQLLSFGRQQNLRPESLPLADFFAAQQALWRNVLGPEAHLQLSLPDATLAVYADRGQLSSALVNLLGNARDAAVGPAEVTISAAEGSSEHGDRDFVRIEVADRGHGMSVEVQARATEPFFSTKEPGKGSGLGLSAVEGFARQSGGQMRIRSQPGHGTTIEIVLPRQPRSQRPPGRSGRPGRTGDSGA